MEAALDYLRLGWSVIPIEPRGKRPLIRWQVYQFRQADSKEIAEWFRRWPNANIAVVTGAVSGLVVLDIDPRHGAAASLEQLEREHGRFAGTATTLTGGGGQHLYFARSGIKTRNRAGILPGIDLRGDGGYVVAPPSVHQSGQRYRWQRSPDVSRLATLPKWLSPGVRDTGAGRAHPVTHWRRLLRQGVDEGQRNNTIASLAGHLLWHGIDPAVATELLVSWNLAHCRPPLSDNDIMRTVQSILHLHQHDDRKHARCHGE